MRQPGNLAKKPPTFCIHCITFLLILNYMYIHLYTVLGSNRKPVNSMNI